MKTPRNFILRSIHASEHLRGPPNHVWNIENTALINIGKNKKQKKVPAIFFTQTLYALCASIAAYRLVYCKVHTSNYTKSSREFSQRHLFPADIIYPWGDQQPRIESELWLNERSHQTRSTVPMLTQFLTRPWQTVLLDSSVYREGEGGL